MRFTAILAGTAMLALGAVHAAPATSILFIGNSFTFGAGSAVRFYRADTVTDLNSEGIGGVPAPLILHHPGGCLTCLETHPGVSG